MERSVFVNNVSIYRMALWMRLAMGSCHYLVEGSTMKTSTTSGHGSSRSIKSYCPPPFRGEFIRTFTTLLINLFAVCGSCPLGFWNVPQFVALIHFLRSSAVEHIPSVTIFRTTILKNQAEQAQSTTWIYFLESMRAVLEYLKTG